MQKSNLNTSPNYKMICFKMMCLNNRLISKYSINNRIKRNNIFTQIYQKLDKKEERGYEKSPGTRSQAKVNQPK